MFSGVPPPIARPRIVRPTAARSRVAHASANTTGFLKCGCRIAVPIRTRFVRAATAPSVTSGSNPGVSIRLSLTQTASRGDSSASSASSSSFEKPRSGSKAKSRLSSESEKSSRSRTLVPLTRNGRGVTVVQSSITLVDVLEQRAPHYLRIYRELKRQIESGQLVPGVQLPAQRELSQTFNVTLMTLRQAMQLLGQEGLIPPRHGRGTFVAERPLSYQMRTLRSLAQEMEAQGQALTTTVLDRRFEEASPHVAEQ